ncbi:MFS transporter, partial [Clostridium perfringens]
IPQQWISTVLLAYRAFTILSNWLAAKVAQGNSRVKLKVIFIIQAMIMMALALTLTLPWMALMSLKLVACFSFALRTAVQLYLIVLADESSAGSKDFAATLQPGASNLRIADGSLLRSLVLDNV